MKKLLFCLSLISSFQILGAANAQMPGENLKCSANYDISGAFNDRKIKTEANEAVKSFLSKRGFNIKTDGSVDVYFEIDLCGNGVFSDCDIVVKNMLGGGAYESIVNERAEKSDDEVVDSVVELISSFDPLCE